MLYYFTGEIAYYVQSVSSKTDERVGLGLTKSFEI